MVQCWIYKGVKQKKPFMESNKKVKEGKIGFFIKKAQDPHKRISCVLSGETKKVSSHPLFL